MPVSAVVAAHTWSMREVTIPLLLLLLYSSLAACRSTGLPNTISEPVFAPRSSTRRAIRPLHGIKCFAEEQRIRAARAGPLAVEAFVNNIGAVHRCVARRVSAANVQAERLWKRATAGADTAQTTVFKTQSLDPATLALLEQANTAGLQHVISVIEGPGWHFVTEKKGVTVHKKYLQPAAGTSASVVDAQSAAKFACVIARGTLNAKAQDLYALFKSNDRVFEYNENCADVRDLEYLKDDTKVSWARSPRVGPFKSRDFVTVVNYRTLQDGTLAVVNRPVEHVAAPATSQYVRAEVLIATNMMRPNAQDPDKTDFISVTHINPGGIVDSAVGAQIMNALCAQAPVKLLLELEKAANTQPKHTRVKA